MSTIFKFFLWAISLTFAQTLFSQDLRKDLVLAKELSNNLKNEEAISLCFKIIDNATKIKHDSVEGHAYLRLGTIYCDLAKLDIGKSYYEKAKAIAKKTKDKHLLALSNFGVATAYQPMLLYDSAIYFYGKSVPYFNEIGDSITASYIYSNLSLLYSKAGEIDSMELYSNKALVIQGKYNDHHGMGVSFSNLGLAAMEEGNYEAAINYYKMSASEFKITNDEKGYSELLRWLGTCYYLKKEYDSSSYYFYQYESKWHDIYHQDYQEQILELRQKFNASQLENDNALKQTKLESSNRLIILLTVVLFSSILIFTVGFMFFRQRRLMTKSASENAIRQLLQEQEIKTAYALLEGQDQERKRIATELHDNLGSILTSLNMFSDTLITKSNPKDIKKIANRIIETSQLANEEVRNISHSLDSGLLKHFGLKSAINHLMEAIKSSKKIDIELELQIDDDINNEYSLEIYRIIQEMTNNAMKHSECTKIRLDISHFGKEMSIIFQDNGIGFDANKISKGLGLKNIEKRVSKLEGEISIESKQGKGSTFIIEISNT